MGSRLYGGSDPWRLFEGVLNEPAVSVALSFVYHVGWFYAMAGVLYWQAWRRDAGSNA
jgi:hypothetical protein